MEDFFEIKEALIKSGVHDAQSDFSSDCIPFLMTDIYPGNYYIKEFITKTIRQG